jgi:hypothetical protein
MGLRAALLFLLADGLSSCLQMTSVVRSGGQRADIIISITNTYRNKLLRVQQQDSTLYCWLLLVEHIGKI